MMQKKLVKKIFWVVSYPKSGNTWMRSILSSLIFSKDGKFQFELLKNIQHFDLLKNYNFLKKINIGDYNNLNNLKILSKYWLEAQKKYNDTGNFTIFKTHSSNVKIYNYEYTNIDNTLGFIYLVRDPRDIAISYSKHLNKSIDETINWL